jgi:hypothetical protein
MEKIAPYYKAVAGLFIPFLGSISSALLEGSKGGTSITSFEWVTAICIGLVAGTTVFSVSNKDPRAEHQDESVRPPNVV